MITKASLPEMSTSLRMPGAFYQELDGSYFSSQTSTDRPKTSRRKRPRVETDQTNTLAQTPYGNVSDSVNSFDLASPSPLVNINYRLAGGLDTPRIWDAQTEDYLNNFDAERDYRPSRYTVLHQRSESKVENDQSAGIARRLTSPHPSKSSEGGWNLKTTAWAMTGGLAGKIFNFCWSTTFGGFSAGGGATYNMDMGTPEVINASTLKSKRNGEDIFSSQDEPRNVPGLFPKDTSNGMATRINQSQRTPTRSQWEDLADESLARNNWVLVERIEDSDDMASPARKKSRASIAGAVVRRPSLRSNVPVSVTANSGASFASARSTTSKSINSHSRRGSGIQSPTRSLSNNNVPHKRMRPSLVTPHKRQSLLTASPPRSPISPEIESFRRQKRRDERKQDETLRKLNDHLQDMIRQGQEALGSKVEILDDDTATDEGYFEDEIS